MKARRQSAALAASIGALVLAAGLGAALPAAAASKDRPSATAPALPSLKVLSPGDVRAYSAALSATQRGDFDAADDAAARIDDTLLMGRLTYRKLMHPSYIAKFDELRAWLKTYGEQPDADRVYTLAKKRQPTGASAIPAVAPTTALAEFRADVSLDAPPAPVVDPTWARVESQAQRLESKTRKLDLAAPKAKVDPKLQASREAYYAGDVKKAYGLATDAGERWIAGLAAFRLERYDEAVRRFDALSTDTAENEWVRSGAAYWAARAATAGGQPDRAPEFLERAAKTPYTFYGLIAERQLGLDAAVTADGMDLGETITSDAAARSQPTPTVLVAGEAGEAVARLVKKDPRARRAAAYVQLGMKTEAGAELRTALMGAAGTETRKTWTNLALALNAPLTSPADLARNNGRSRFDLAQYPTPALDPQGGFTLDKALVYALVRQESKFDASAVSSAGAYGLMQLMPATAAVVAGDGRQVAFDPAVLHDPSINLRLGQDYVSRLLVGTQDDILKAVAAYNIGPEAIRKTVAKLGGDMDSLMVIESMPGAQTREFVEKVVAGYWIYRNLFGQASPSLNAAAAAAKAVTSTLDR